MKPTIFITVNRAYIVRNLLLNSFFDLLRNKYQVVILSPADTQKELADKFENCIFETLYARPLSPFKKKLEKIFISTHRALIYNESSEVFSGLGRGLNVKGDTLVNGELVRFKKIRYFLAKYVFGTVLAHEPIRNFVKWIDRKIFTCDRYDELFKKYNPELIFVTALGADDEIAVLRNAKKYGVRSVGMVGSWDNLSKWGLRERVDRLAVWGDYMKDEALKFQGYKKDQVMVFGVPQFDHYLQAPYSREEFVKKFGLDENKKTIFFGSEGPICPDDVYVVSFLQKQIKNGTLSDYQILVRPHFGYQIDINRFLPLVDNRTVYIDQFRKDSGFKDGTALDLTTAENLVAEIKYCDAHITSTSTLVLDIIANGRQPILYRFDEDKNKEFKESTKRLYDTLWFREILSFDLDNMANNENELVEKIKEIVINTEKDVEKRNKLLERFCHKVDGKSGERLFEVTHNLLN